MTLSLLTLIVHRLVYLTSQSDASVDSLTTMAETIAQLINDYDNANQLQIPIFVSSESLPVDNGSFTISLSDRKTFFTKLSV